MSEKCILPKWHEDKCITETVVFDRVRDLIAELGLENLIVMQDHYLYLAFEGFLFRFVASLIDVDEIDC